jgi:hypothetical protein
LPNKLHITEAIGDNEGGADLTLRYASGESWWILVAPKVLHRHLFV